MNISELVSKTVATGVPPLELTYKPINCCQDSFPVAYRTDLTVNSVELGSIYQHEYTKVSDSREIGGRVFEWAAAKALKDAKAFSAAGRHPSWISVYCPVEYATSPDFYEKMKALVGVGYKKNKKGVKLCLEFSDKLLLGGEAARKAVLDLKLLGIHSIISLSESETAGIFKLVDIPVDAVVFSPRMTAMIDDRNKKGIIPALVQYLRSMNVGVIAEGELGSDRIREFGRLDCDGYISSQEAKMSADQAILQKEGED